METLSHIEGDAGPLKLVVTVDQEVLEASGLGGLTPARRKVSRPRGDPNVAALAGEAAKPGGLARGIAVAATGSVRFVELAATLALVAVLTGCGSKPDGGSCGCRVEGEGVSATLVMSWECYCEAYGCRGQFEAVCTDFRERIEYPGCGLTVLRLVAAGGPIESVFDSSGAMVGGSLASDTATYRCPSNPEIETSQVRAGTFPSADCDDRSCGMCATAAPSCYVADGGVD